MTRHIQMSKSKTLFSEVSKFWNILSVNPVTNAVSKRSCSTLRHLKYIFDNNLVSRVTWYLMLLTFYNEWFHGLYHCNCRSDKFFSKVQSWELPKSNLLQKGNAFCMYVCVYACMYVSVYLCIYLSLYICIYIYIYIYRVWLNRTIPPFTSCCC